MLSAYARAAREADLTIAEVGAWSNPISPHEQTRKEALALCKERLALADEIGTRCCVNIAGSRAERWDGPWLKSCHAKDIALSDRLTVHLDEVRPGTGALDYEAFLRGVDRLDPDMPVMLEHLPTPQDYELAAAFVRSTAERIGVALR